MNSRGAATECSPGREPGVSFDTISAPEGRKSLSESFALRGCGSGTTPTPAWAPGATLSRRSAAASALETSRRYGGA